MSLRCVVSWSGLARLGRQVKFRNDGTPAEGGSSARVGQSPSICHKPLEPSIRLADFIAPKSPGTPFSSVEAFPFSLRKQFILPGDIISLFRRILLYPYSNPRISNYAFHNQVFLRSQFHHGAPRVRLQSPTGGPPMADAIKSRPLILPKRFK